MRHFLRISLLAMGLNLLGSSLPTIAQENRTGQSPTASAQAMLPLCQAGVNSTTSNPGGERCMGILSTLVFVSRVLPDNLKFCQPTGTTPRDMVEAIGAFIVANPEAAMQDFRLIALAAMRNRWPCQE